MTHVLRLVALGTRLEVRCTGDSRDLLASSMRLAWSRCLDTDDDTQQPAPAEAEPVEARLDDPGDLDRRLMLTTQDITRALISAQIGSLLMLHAGAVSNPLTGQSLVYVAAGGTGKTTLTRRLGQRFGYLTDETVGVDEALTILPYPKPLSVRRPDGLGPKDEVSPDTLRLELAPPQPHVARVVLLDRRPEWVQPEVEEVLFMDALFALTEQSSSLPRLDRPLHRLGDLIDTCGPVLRVRYAESAEIENDLAHIIGGTR
ncbi:hypothetical protein GCM10023168_23960 [Fodinibacter luteus]|uniref:AAA+ ATPase domain-containing protein n=1 Tax=Fodinibacter luteus TaxID=552064 RepID=A0ABP8KJ64_9MICO